jgi:hypothetical protein
MASTRVSLPDLVGRRFHRLTVIALHPEKGRRRKWLCRCDCGGVTTLLSTQITSASVKTCGCRLIRTPEDRFWEKVEKSEGCWEWTGNLSEKGYGLFAPKKGHPMGAHRYSYLLANGHLPADLMICHHCDNPKCVRPDHLFAGTCADNLRDMREKGRWKRKNLAFQDGDRNHQSKFGEEKVRWALWLHAEGYRQAEIMRLTGIPRKSVWNIVHGVTWKHLQ